MGLFEKLKSGLARTKETFSKPLDGLFAMFSNLDDDFYEQLEEALILSDMGIETSLSAVSALRARVKKEKIRDGARAKECLCHVLCDMLRAGTAEFPADGFPLACLVVGVNGVGKTTTIGKLGTRFRTQGKKVVFAAADTFRAAAAAQLSIWAERSGAVLVSQSEGADPASVVFDAAVSAKACQADLLLVDTAGRLHSKQNLMNELAKISRILDRELPDYTRETLLILDATTGQNGLIQAKQFAETTGITGIVLTKLDGTAKGGIVFSIADTLKIPVKFVGIGEGAEDFMPFDPEMFVNAILFPKPTVPAHS